MYRGIHDEHNQTDILTWGFDLAPAFPVKPVAVGVCSPLQWRNRPRFSRGSLTPGYVNYCELSKSTSYLLPAASKAKTKKPPKIGLVRSPFDQT